MSELLLVRAPATMGGEFSWLPVDNKGEAKGDTITGDLQQLSSHVNRQRLVLLVPGEEVLLTMVKIPGKGRITGDLIAYTLEEQLADDVEQLCFAHGRRQPDGRITAAAMRKERLDHWLETLRSAELYPFRMVPESTLLPLNEHDWAILEQQHRTILKYDGDLGTALETESAIPLMKRLLDERGDTPPPTVALWTDDRMSGTAAQLEALGCKVDRHTLPENELSLFCREAVKHQEIDLMQGAPRQANAGSSKGWLATAAIGALALALHLGSTGYHYWQLQTEQTSVDERIEQLFRDTFPEITRVVDPIVQAGQQLAKRRNAASQGRDAMLDLLYHTGNALRQDSSLQMTGLEFRHGVMQIRLQGRSVGSIERLKQRLEISGKLKVEVLSATSNEQGFESRLEIKGRV
ncbi:MAG: type II secretion system protein GspL [Sedimenticola sp.]